jgi:hypothetical protein
MTDDLRALIEAVEAAKPRPECEDDEFAYAVALGVESFADNLIAALRAKLEGE